MKACIKTEVKNINEALELLKKIEKDFKKLQCNLDLEISIIPPLCK